MSFSRSSEVREIHGTLAWPQRELVCHREIVPSSSPIFATMKLHSMTRVPRVTVSCALPRHSSAPPSTEHSRPQYLVSSSSARPHFLYVCAARMDTPDPVSTRKLTPFPSIRPGRYSPFPTMTDSSVAAPSWGPASIVTAATVRFLSVLPQRWSDILS